MANFKRFHGYKHLPTTKNMRKFIPVRVSTNIVYHMQQIIDGGHVHFTIALLLDRLCMNMATKTSTFNKALSVHDLRRK